MFFCLIKIVAPYMVGDIADSKWDNAVAESKTREI